MTLASGHVAEELEGEELAGVRRDWKPFQFGLVRITPGPWIFPKSFLRFADKYYKFQFRPSDVLLSSYPKSGSTWMQEIIWTMRNNPDLNNPNASRPVLARTPFMEHDMLFDPPLTGAPDSKNPFNECLKELCPGRNPEDGVCLKIAECTPEPRTIRTHLALSVLPPDLLDTCKIVYVARNPKDVMVSFYHFCRLVNYFGFKGNWDSFIDRFMNNTLVFGSYAQHLKEAWGKRDHQNMHIIFYENLKADVMGELKRLDTFLGTYLTPQQMENVAQHTSFKKMKKRGKSLLPHLENSTNEEIEIKDGDFFRKGEVGDWKDKFSPDVLAKVDAWIEENIESIGVDFMYST